ncbi:hypothetical protein NLN92_18980 [Citrobacter portucalensis]|uniref:hypothetical protein n=1 Tax=Citrobacter portucalensis TaxID=1639133 RepID=UPI00226B2FB5|nr:hypothetical protein [Citrobacter portucalensis]MCX8980091.1 hypothetical protein [Citrobacter portucalensis]
MSEHQTYVQIPHVQIVREHDGKEEVVRVYDEDGEVVLCLPAYIQDNEVKLILRQLNSVFSKGHRCGDAYRTHKIKAALCLVGND